MRDASQYEFTGTGPQHTYYAVVDLIEEIKKTNALLQAVANSLQTLVAQATKPKEVAAKRAYTKKAQG